MVTLTKKGFKVEVSTGGDAAENYVETINSIVELLQSQQPDMKGDDFYLLQMLKAMLPDADQAKAFLNDVVKK